MRHTLHFRLGVLTLILALPRSAATQEDVLTLERAVALARARAAFAAVPTARRQIAEGRARAEGAFQNPTFEWRRENLRSDLPPDIFGTVQLPLDVTGRRLALRSAVGAAIDRGRADSATAALALDLEAARSFLRTALAQELYEVARDERRARAELAQFDAQRFREGAVAEVAAMRTLLEADRARMTEASARAEFERARGDLARLLARSPDSLPRLAAISVPDSLIPPPDVSRALSSALAQRADLQALRHGARESQLRAAGERRGAISDLQLVAGYKQTSSINTGVLGMIVPIPLFNRNEGARERARGEAIVADAERLDAERRVRNEVRAAINSYQAIRDAMRDGASGIDRRAADVARIAEGAYREGAISLVELVEAQRARAESRAAALRWAVDAHLALLELNRALGAPILDSLEPR